MVKQLPLADFLETAQRMPVIDVRTPAEFAQGHVAGAYNIPLFSNEERAKVGTMYKQTGRQPAILLGFEIVGAKWADFIRQAEIISPEKNVLVYCWRGGMRSGAMAWALDLYGFNVSTLQKGYKTYRNFCLQTLEKEYPFIVLSGKTGSAKTETLLAMKQLGEQVIDLEGLAEHQGSAFGSKGKKDQPSQEHFENQLADELNKMDPAKRIWVENESVLIGKRIIPKNIYSQMLKTHIIHMQLPTEERVQFLEKEYGGLDKEFLKESVRQIGKRLGIELTQKTILAIDENRMTDFIQNVLHYYDKTYNQGQERRAAATVHPVEFDNINPPANAKSVIQLCDQLFGADISAFKTTV